MQTELNAVRHAEEQLLRIESLGRRGEQPDKSGDAMALVGGNEESSAEIDREQWRTLDAALAGLPRSESYQGIKTQLAVSAITEIKSDGRTLAPLGRMAYLPGQVQQQGSSSPSLKVHGGRLAFGGKQAKGNLVDIALSDCLGQLHVERQRLQQETVSLRDKLVKNARAMLVQHLEGGDDAPPVNDEGQALNEEGLPFVDLTEVVANENVDDTTPRGRNAFVPLHREEKTKEERQAWMEQVLSDIDNGGNGSDTLKTSNRLESESGKPKEEPMTSAEPRPSYKRVASTERPAPIKSVLKPSTMPTSPLPKFGAAGIRRGFFNLNPSSPAAEHSSDPVENLRWDEDPMSGSTSSLGSASERLARSTDLGVSEGQKKKKKSVRIQSPDARDCKPPSEAKRLMGPIQKASSSKRREIDAEDEGTEEEAAKIINLLGMDVLKGHPQYDAMVESTKAQEEANRIAAQEAAEKYPPLKPSTSLDPAIRKDVVERQIEPQTAGKSARPSSNGKGPSAFKRNLMASAKPLKPPPRSQKGEAFNSVEELPAGPRTSIGMSALERASQSDHTISKERTQQGLPAAVPHARPSKAYAEKLEARRRGEQGPNEGNAQSKQDGAKEEDQPAKMSKVRFGTEDNGAVAVKVGTAATEASRLNSQPAPEQISIGAYTSGDNERDSMESDGESDCSSQEEALRAMGLQTHDEELDDDTVDALGYFSDEDHDPDIGFDSDDLVEAAPNFASDSAAITDEELRREYERTKAAVLRSHGISLRRAQGAMYGMDDDDEDEEEAAMEGADLSLAGHREDDAHAGSSAGQSRFRRERVQRAMLGHRAESRELGTGRKSGNGEAHNGQSAMDALSEAQNLGPSMLIPQLANVRFPKTEATDARVDNSTMAPDMELDGESDEEDDQLLDVMRARLEQRDTLRQHSADHTTGISAAKKDARQHDVESDGAPVVRAAAGGGHQPAFLSTPARPTDAPATNSSNNDGTGSKPIKKASLFKARMQQS